MFETNGTKSKIIMDMVQEFDFSTLLASKVFESIIYNETVLNESGILKISVKSQTDDNTPNYNNLNLMIPGTQYNLNVKRAALAVIAFILDAKLTNGMINLGLALSGVELKAITILKEENFCIVKEMLLHNDDEHDESSLLLGQECVNNDIYCRKNIDGYCNLEQSEIKTILDNLYKEGVIHETISGRYKISFI